MDNNEQLLESLRQEEIALCNAVGAQEERLNKQLFSFFKNIEEGSKLEMMPIKCNINSPLSFNDKKNTYEVRLKIEWYNDEGKTWSDGSLRADFGSDITLYILDNHIKMNYGTMGDYTHNDKGLYTRALFVAKLWENEDTICAIARAIVNINDYNNLIDTRFKIRKIKDDIEWAKRQEERNQILNKIKEAKYICKGSKHFINERYDYDQGKWINDGKEYKYYDYEEIKKITDTNVLTVDIRYGENYRRKIDKVIFNVKHNYLFLKNDIINSEPITEGDL